ncbi:Uncharacterized protein dnl_12060 [Desulfonema limicola]|uniref:Uncharacterized protein n=1 Tax=Desulfonema limicola TaxID=45656 RepID=A0A975GFA1_9BACT|nr:Uncharacterized protein dnl_12060 [Desulfonema limicola]
MLNNYLYFIVQKNARKTMRFCNKTNIYKYGWTLPYKKMQDIVGNLFLFLVIPL